MSDSVWGNIDMNYWLQISCSSFRWPRLSRDLGPKDSSKMDKRSKLVLGTDKRLYENGDHQFAKAIFLMKHC